jgi:hypothetical protein
MACAGNASERRIDGRHHFRSWRIGNAMNGFLSPLRGLSGIRPETHGLRRGLEVISSMRPMAQLAEQRRTSGAKAPIFAGLLRHG